MAGIGERNRHRRRGEIEDPGRIERVPVHADDPLAIDRSHVPAMHEPADAAAAHDLCEMEIGFGANEIVASDDHGHAPICALPVRAKATLIASAARVNTNRRIVV